MFRKILIANRGEIACRIARTCRRLGIAVATVHSEADRDALHVREIGDSVLIGDAPATASYLQIDRIVAAARQVGADAVHPGYGFLAENPGLAEALEAAGIAFIGPSADVLARFGDKAAAKAEAIAAGVPVVPGTATPSSSVEEITAAVAGMSYPILLKAAAGGGGKGMRVVESAATLTADIEAATREGASAFGNPALIVERYIRNPRHIEVQVLGDGQGNVIHLFDRECSLQRRHQKVIEEAPVLSLPPVLRRKILDDAVRLCAAVRYRGLGTVEFIASGEEAFFLEVNPRIQVEHPVTEEITGLDLVELQLRSVAEGRLPLRQDDVTVTGVAIEARLYAEDPETGFLPSTGRVSQLVLPKGLRVDSGIAEGMSVTQYYDPMIAKLIAHGPTREEALSRLSAALAQTAVAGVRTNLAFLRLLSADPQVRANEVHTHSIAPMLDTLPRRAAGSTKDFAVAAFCWLRAQRQAGGTDSAWRGWTGLTGWRLSACDPDLAAAAVLRLSEGETEVICAFGPLDAGGGMTLRVGEAAHYVLPGDLSGTEGLISVDGRRMALRHSVRDGWVSCVLNGVDHDIRVQPFLSGRLIAGAKASGDETRAPLMGQVIAIDVAVGDQVRAGDRLMVMESMKMELALKAQIDGVVTAVNCAAGDMVERDQIVVVTEAAAPATAA